MDNRRKIPVPPKVVMSEVGTQKDKQSAPLVERVQAMRLTCRQIRRLLRLGRYAEGNIVPEAADFTLSRKAASETVGARTANRHR